ncbi:hypothetical protein V5O48_016784, partial [Marasmius crinis-equi]
MNSEGRKEAVNYKWIPSLRLTAQESAPVCYEFWKTSATPPKAADGRQRMGKRTKGFL